MTSLDSKVHVPEDVQFRELETEAVILDLRSGTYFGLDPVGTRMWSLLAQYGCIRPAYEVLVEEYDVSEQRLQQDLLDLVEKLATHGLLQVDHA